MKDLLKQLCSIVEKDIPVVLVSVVQHQGSTPRGGGSKMLVTEQGLLCGTVGGGLAEGLCIEACKDVLRTKQPEIKNFTLTGHMAAQSEMICGGTLDVLLCPIHGAQDLAFYTALVKNMEEEVFVLQHISAKGEIYRFLSVNGQWQHGPWDVDAHLSASQKEALLAKLPHGEESKLWQDPDNQDFYVIEKYIAPWKMIILGGGHISRPTAQVAALSGFQVIVLDDREEFSQKERFPWAEATYTVPEFEQCFANCPPTTNTCLIIVTRGHVHDKTVLSQALRTKASYIGMIGSKRKRQEVYDTLKAEGISQAQLDAVHCPIGLNIQAETPEEIAVSIVAECIAHKRTN